MKTTITPTEERVRLWIKNGRTDSAHVRDVVARWLERMATRQSRHINEPSLILETEYDVVRGQTLLYAFADSFSDTMPDWLRTTPVSQGVVNLNDIHA